VLQDLIIGLAFRCQRKLTGPSYHDRPDMTISGPESRQRFGDESRIGNQFYCATRRQRKIGLEHLKFTRQHVPMGKHRTVLLRSGRSQ
jgi:hypothetical protein